MEDNKARFYIVSIIAVVAIVGLVVLIVQASTGSRSMYTTAPRAYAADTTATEAEDATGQAFRANAIPKGATIYVGEENDKKPDSYLCVCKGNGGAAFSCQSACKDCCGNAGVSSQIESTPPLN